MKIKFLKDHVAHSLGDVVDLDEPAANYLIAVGVAEEVNEKEAAEKVKQKELKAEKQTKELKTDKETK